MTDALLFLLVVGVVLIAIGVEAWLRGRWR